MARRAREVTCSAEEERILRNIASSRTATFSEVLRAKIILYSLQGMPRCTGGRDPKCRTFFMPQKKGRAWHGPHALYGANSLT